MIAGRYEVTSPLRSTRHAHVFVAYDEATGGQVVVKLLRAAAASDPRGLRRMEREVDALSRVKHPNVVRMIEWIDNPPMLSMEQLNGPTLRNDLREHRRYDVRDLRQLGLDLAAALTAVHAADLVHADVKPANIVVVGAPDRRRFTLIDFHLSRRPGEVGPGLGTRLFAAPEQAAGGVLGPASDAWGIGIALYRAATAKLPFQGKEGQPQILELAEPSAQRSVKLPSEFTDLIDMLLSLDPAARPSLAVVTAALQSI